MRYQKRNIQGSIFIILYGCAKQCTSEESEETNCNLRIPLIVDSFDWLKMSTVDVTV